MIGLLLVLVTALLLLPSRKQASASNTYENAAFPSALPSDAAPTTPADAKIPRGVSIAGVPVGGMTGAQAIEAVRAATTDLFEQEDMIISLGDRTFVIRPEVSSAHWDIDRAVQTALGGERASIELSPAVDKNAVKEALQGFYDDLGGIYIPSGYWLEGDAPDMDSQSGVCQTLVINQGAAGHLADLQDALDKVMEAYSNGVFQVTLDAPGEVKEPAPLDLEQVYRQVSIAPQNPRVDPQTLEVIPGKDGYGFDAERAAAMLQQSKTGEAVRIAMEFIPLTASEEDAWFQDTLGYCKTEYADNENRTQNLRLACEKLNGLILQPGDTLSYNEVLGKRTREAGYLPAPAYSGTDLVDEVGGGICQVSSTLYLSSLFAELTVVERKNHGFPASYIPLGLDATVNWGTTDLKLRNDYDLPVKILAEVSDGFVKIRIMGVERRDYYVKMEYRVDDHPSYAAAYRCKYDRSTDEQISRVLDHTSIYLEDVWCNPGFAESAVDETQEIG